MKQTELGVTELHIVFDGLDPQGEDLPVDERKSVREDASFHDVSFVEVTFLLLPNSVLKGHVEIREWVRSLLVLETLSSLGACYPALHPQSTRRV